MASMLNEAAEATATAKFVELWKSRLAAAKANGPVALWGAGAKGVTFGLLMDPDGALIDHVIDINKAKQGKFIAGSGLQVLSPQDAAARKPATIFVMNPNYLKEITEMMAQFGIRAEITVIQ